MESLIIYPKTKVQLEALKTMAKALGINFETAKPYDSDFVAKIENSKKEVAEGKVTRIKTEDLQDFLSL